MNAYIVTDGEDFVKDEDFWMLVKFAERRYHRTKVGRMVRNRMYKLIIVDDEPRIAEGMGQLFPWENIGFEIARTFVSAVEALEYLQHEHVDVVLSDIQMPDMTGLDLCRALQSMEGVRIVLFSSYQNYEYFRSAIQYNVADYLLKPISYATLLECFSKLRDQLDAENQVAQERSEGYYEQIVRTVNEYLDAHYQDGTLTKCAERVNLSPTYLSRVYKEKSGVSFSDRLLHIRMERACELLSKPDYKGYDVAYDVGYDNPKNFSRAFKNYFGITPSEYRLQKKAGGAE